MGYKVIPVTINHVSQNRSGEWLEPIGVVVHETATPNATDEAEQRYFNGGYRGALAHEFADYDSITQLCPLDEVAWHAGYKANHRYISIEMCHFNDPEKFAKVWQYTVGRVATWFVEYGWEIKYADGDLSSTLVTHHWVTKNLGGTTHVDPTSYLAQFGCTFQDFINDVKTAVAELKAAKEAPAKPAPAPQPVEQDIEVFVQGKNVTDGAVEGVLKADGRTYVPVRLVGEAFGEQVGWDDKCKKIILNGTELDTSFIKDGVGYAWAREVAEALRANLVWDGENMAVIFS